MQVVRDASALWADWGAAVILAALSLAPCAAERATAAQRGVVDVEDEAGLWPDGVAAATDVPVTVGLVAGDVFALGLLTEQLVDEVCSESVSGAQHPQCHRDPAQHLPAFQAHDHVP